MSCRLHSLPLAHPRHGMVSNAYPGTGSRERLAKENGVPDSRVQIWFQKQRSRLHVQRKEERGEHLEQKQTGNEVSRHMRVQGTQTTHNGSHLIGKCLISLRPEQDGPKDNWCHPPGLQIALTLPRKIPF